LNKFSGVDLLIEIENNLNTELKWQFIIKVNISLFINFNSLVVKGNSLSA
jgi:hypothetical protein